MRFISLCVGLLSGAVAAQADPVSEAEARKFLFPVRGAELAVVGNSGLDATQQAITTAILKSTEAEGQALYYGALAVSPSFFAMMAENPGTAALSGLLQITRNYHSAEAASRAALDACRAARKRGHADCVVAGQIRPRGYSARPLQMSVDATEAFKSYRKGSGPKALAISPATPAFGIGRGDGADDQALTRCNALAQPDGRQDCETVIRN